MLSNGLLQARKQLVRILRIGKREEVIDGLTFVAVDPAKVRQRGAAAVSANGPPRIG
jgi:hypothetical protein